MFVSRDPCENSRSIYGCSPTAVRVPSGDPGASVDLFRETNVV